MTGATKNPNRQDEPLRAQMTEADRLWVRDQLEKVKRDTISLVQRSRKQNA